MRRTGRLSTQKKPRSSRQRAARDLPEPEAPVMTTSRSMLRLPVPGLLAHRRSGRLAGRGAFFLRAELLSEPARELASRVVSLELQKVVPRGDLDEDREVPAGADRHLHVRERDTEDLVAALVEAESVVPLARAPRIQPDRVLDELRHAHRGDPEQVLDIDDAHPA